MDDLNKNSSLPVVQYNNADTKKNQIISENKSRSGIYLWRNLVNKKAYIGSSKDLGRRLRDYFNINYLEGNDTMQICRALLAKPIMAIQTFL
jgi:excinuclease UvrABC nuclease subunit